MGQKLRVLYYAIDYSRYEIFQSFFNYLTLYRLTVRRVSLEEFTSNPINPLPDNIKKIVLEWSSGIDYNLFIDFLKNNQLINAGRYCHEFVSFPESLLDKLIELLIDVEDPRKLMNYMKIGTFCFYHRF